MGDDWSIFTVFFECREARHRETGKCIAQSGAAGTTKKVCRTKEGSGRYKERPRKRGGLPFRAPPDYTTREKRLSDPKSTQSKREIF